MAQPVFDGHPLEDYFQDSGEASQPMPGGISEPSLGPYLTGQPSISRHAEKMEKLCLVTFGALQSLSSLFSSDRASLRTQAFAERFKYGVISSSLLSPAFPATPMVDSHRRVPLPGKLSSEHSRTPSLAESMVTDTPSLSMPPDPDTPVWPISLSFTIAVAAFSARFYLFALLLLAGTLYYMRIHRVDMHSKPDVMTPSLLALQHLVSAGQLWDTVINDTFTLLENEEQSVFHGAPSSSSLRVALSTSLLTTQTQCDHVRQLLSAITSPSELAQLAEMYAPPSPMKSTFSRSSDSRRPLSHPGPSPRGTPDRTRKRSTWNGSYASLVHAGAPLSPRREKRRSDLNALIGATSPCPPRTRPKNAPSPPLLADVSEEDDGMVTAESSVAEDDAETSFGAAALDLYRNRVSGGLRALALSPGSGRRTTMSPGSKYTRMHTPRHPFLLSSLQQSLQNALASKRFACSHLLALRFEDDEDEVYWEDVRAVMDLLTSTLVDASSRLSEVLEDVEEARADDGSSVSAGSPVSPPPPPPPPAFHPHPRPLGHMVSFAPTPSHLARFAAHISAISSALDDAQDQLAQCVAALGASPGHSSRPSTSSCSDAVAALEQAQASPPLRGSPSLPATHGHGHDHPALQAYERLRRELGLALRECERGRERLVQVVAPVTPCTEPDAEAEGKAEGPLDPEPERDASDPIPDPTPNAHSTPDPTPDSDAHPDPPPDPEQEPPIEPVEHVFEADSLPPVFTRPRSTLSREDRIRLVRAQRGAREGAIVAGCVGAIAGVGADADDRPPGYGHGHGPTPDVVQELKDVIWKVSQRRTSAVTIERHVSLS